MKQLIRYQTVSYLIAGYATALLVLTVLHGVLAPRDFAYYSLLQALLNIVIIASGLGLSTAVDRRTREDRAVVRSHIFSLSVELSAIQAIAAVPLGFVAIVVLLVTHSDNAPTTLVLVSITGCMSSLVPLWGIGRLGWYREFAVALFVLKLIQAGVLLVVPPGSCIEWWLASQAAVYGLIYWLFVGLGRREGLAYTRSTVQWIRLAREAVKTDLSLDVLKVLWVNWIQILGGSLGREAIDAALLYLDRVLKSMVGAAEQYLRLQRYSNPRSLWLPAEITTRGIGVLFLAVLAIGLSVPIVVASGQFARWWLLPSSFMAAAGYLALINGYREWRIVRGRSEHIQLKNGAMLVALALSGLLGFFLTWRAYDSYIAIVATAILGELLVWWTIRGVHLQFRNVSEQGGTIRKNIIFDSVAAAQSKYDLMSDAAKRGRFRSPSVLSVELDRSAIYLERLDLERSVSYVIFGRNVHSQRPRALVVIDQCARALAAIHATSIPTKYSAHVSKWNANYEDVEPQEGDVLLHCDFGFTNLYLSKLFAESDENALVVLDPEANGFFTEKTLLVGPRYVDLAVFSSCLLGRVGFPRALAISSNWCRDLVTMFIERYEHYSGTSVSKTVLFRYTKQCVTQYFARKFAFAPLSRAAASFLLKRYPVGELQGIR
jgi:hypothetical protein